MVSGSIFLNVSLRFCYRLFHDAQSLGASEISTLAEDAKQLDIDMIDLYSKGPESAEGTFNSNFEKWALT